MLTKDLRDEWVAALRSGIFEQTKEVLIDGNGKYCAIGVLVRTAADRRNIDFWELSQPITAELGMKNFVEIAARNDAGATFAEIAEYIQNSLPVQESREAVVA